MRAVRALLLVLCLAGPFHPAAAQTLSADDALEAAMVHWRAASWYVRLGDSNLTAIEAEAFNDDWRIVATLSRPALHNGDARWTETVKQIAQLGDTAADQIDRNDVPGAAAALAKISDALAQSRQRAGTQGFPDGMRRLREIVERLHRLLPFEPQRRGASFDDALRGRVSAAANEALTAATALTPQIPPRWAGNEKLKSLLAQNLEGLRNLREALDRKASGLEVAGLLGVVHANYNLLFIDYGA